jgi:hypothetical protein
MADDPLKLAALDAEDLSVFSALLQDAVFKVGDMAWRPAERRFAAVVNRFDWGHGHDRRKGPWRRRQAGLSFDRVMSARLRNIRADASDAVLSLLAVEFEPGEAPGGTVTLHFSGGGAVGLEVECIEARLADLGPAWETANRPDHDLSLVPEAASESAPGPDPRPGPKPGPKLSGA